MKIENFKLEERVLFEAGAVIQAAEAAAADQANNDAAGAGETGAADNADGESAELESLAEMPVPPEMAGSDNADDSADADAAGNVAADPESDAGSNAISFLDAPISAAASETSERILVVLNSSVADADSIIAGLGENVEVLKLTAGTDALDSINDYLDAHADTEYSAIHIVSHGNEGYISLNGERIEAATLNPADWKAIGEHLSDDADILIYGCDTAKSDEGKALVQSIADLTGADVAASTDSTGANGDWDLEYRSGLIEAATLAPESYRYDLESITITVDTAFDDASKGLTFREAITEVNEGAVGNEYIINFDVQDKNEYDALLGCVYLTNDIAIEKSVIIDGGSVDYNNHTGIWIIVERGKDGDTADANDINATITISDTATLTVRNNLTISRYQGHDDDNEVSGTVKPKVNLIAEGNVVISSGATLSAFDDFEIGTLSNAGDLVLYGTNHSFSADASGSFGNVTYVSLYQSARKAMWGAVFNEMVISTPEIVEGTYGSLTLKVGELVRDNGYTRRVFYYGELIEKSTDSNSLSNITSLYKYEYNITGNITADNLIIGNGATLNVTGAVDAENTTVGTNVSLTHIAEANRHRGALKVSGDFDGGTITNYGTLTLSGANNTGSGTQLGNVTYNGADGQTIISGTYNNLTIATAGTATATGNIAAASTTINSGVTLDADSSLAAGTLTNNGSIAVGGAFSAAGENFGNVTYDGAEAQNIFGGTYNNLTLFGGDKTLSDAVTVTGELTAGVKINAAYDLTLSGVVSGTGTVDATAGTITYNGTDQTVLAGAYHNLTLTGTTIEDVKTLAGAVTVGGEFSATNATVTRGEAAENVSLTLSDAGNNTTPSTLISGVSFNGISVTNTSGDGSLWLNEVNNTADANSTGIKFVFDAQITVGAITYGQTLGDIVITAKNNLGETILSGTVAELGWKWQLNGETVANSTVLNVTAGTAYNLFTNTDSSVGSQNVVVNKATLTITAQGISKVYGQTDAEAAGTCYTVVSGLVNGDTAESIGLNVTWVRGENGTGENVILTGTDAEGNPIYGGYAITINGELTSGNYNLVYAEQDAVLTITPKVLLYADLKGTFTAREYDGTSDVGAENIMLTHSQIEEGYSVAWDSAKYFILGTENETADVGVENYLIKVSGLKIVDGEGNINYNYVFNREWRNYINLSNMIVAKNIEVVANGNGSSITYGESPDLTYTVYEYTPGEGEEAGVRGNEWTLNDLTGELGVSEYANPAVGESVTATITQGTLINENNPNYNITFTGGSFTVNGRAPETKSLTVTTAEDVLNDVDDKISLREAILYAAQDAAAVKDGTLAESALAVDGVYTITFGNEVSTITVSSALMIKADAFADAALVIDGAGQVTLSGNGTSQILNVAARNDVTVNGITFTQGYSADTHGGAVYNSGKLTITDSTFTSNAANNFGGAIYNADDLTITGSTFTKNEAKQGGAIWNSGTVQVTDAVFTDNTLRSSGKGGNLYNSAGSAVLERTLFKANNTAQLNGVGTLFYVAGGTVDVIESTVYGSTTTGSGGYSYGFHGASANGHVVTITSGATLNMINSTSYVSARQSSYDTYYNNGGTLNVINSIITTHRKGTHWGGNVIGGAYNNYASAIGEAVGTFSDTTNTFALNADSEASGGGTLVGKLDGSYYYLTRDAERNRIWQQVGGDQFYAFDAADTTNYGLKYTGTDPETGSESVITGLVYTTALNGVSRVLTLDTFNMGSHALTPVDPATVGSLTVTTAHDTSFANSLRVVLAYAETLDGEQTITFADGITIVYLHDDLNINKSVTIDGGTTPRIVDTNFPEESAKLSETMATGVVIRGYNERQNAYIRIADDATLAVENYLTISHWLGIDYDGDVKAGGNKPQVNVTGGNVTINQDAKLTVYDNFETGTLINNGSLFLSGEKNDFHAADGGDFGNVTYVALHHSAKPTLGFIEVDIADPNIVAGTYKTLSVYSADLIRYQGWSRVPWFYGSTVANSRDGGTLTAQTTAEVTAYGNVTAENLIIGDGVTLKIAANGDATQKGDLTVTGTTTVGSSEVYSGITDPVRGTLIVEGNITAATLTNIGGITVGGDFTATAENYGKVTYKGNADQKVSAGTYTDLVIATNGTATAAGAVTADTTTVGETATFDVDGNLTAGTLTNNGTIALSGTLSGTLNGTSWGNMSYYGSSAQEVFAGTYGNLTLSGEGVKTLAGAIVVNGDFTANAAFGTANDLTLHGAVSGTGVINATAGTVTYDLDSTEEVQVILAGMYYNLALSGGTGIMTSATVSNDFSATNTKLQNGTANQYAALTLKKAVVTGTSEKPSSSISYVTFHGISITNGDGDAAPLYVSALTNSVINSERIEYVMDATVAIGTIDYGTALGDVILTITSKNDPNDVTTGTVRELGWSWQIADSDGDGDTNDEIVDATTGTAYNLIAPSGALEEVTLVVNKIYEVITVDIADDLVNDADGKTSLREAVNTTNKVDSRNIEYTIQFAETITAVNLLNDLSITSSVIMNAGNGVSISVASGNDGDPGDDNSIDAEIQIAQNVTLTVNGNLTISRFHGNDNDSELNNIASKPKVNLVGEGSVLISAGATLTAFDHVTIGTLSNKGSLLLYGADNDFNADATGSFGDVTYIGLHHDAVTGVNSPLPTLNFPAPDVVAGTYGNLTFISAELMKDGFSRTIVPYGDTRKGNFWVDESLNQISTTSDHITSLVVDGVLNATTLVINGGVILDVNGNFNGGTLTNNGTLILSGAENTASGTLGNVVYDGTGTQNVIGGTYGKLTLENGTKVMSSTTATKVGLNFTATDTTIRSDSSSLASLTVTDAGTATSASTAVSGVKFVNMAVVNTANAEKLLHVSILNNAKDEATTGVNLVTTTVDDLTFTYGTELGDVAITVRNGAGDVISSGQTLEELGWSLQKADAGAEGGYITLDYNTILNVAESGTYRIVTSSGYAEEVVITVNKAKVTITADNASKTYGDADPEQFTYQAPVGLVGTDTVTVTLERATGENAGTYAITVNASMADEISGNYDIKTVNGTFTITAKIIIVTPDSNQSASSDTFTYTVADENFDPVEVTLNGALTVGKVGDTYVITQGTMTDANNPNYHIIFAGNVGVLAETASTVVTITDDIVDAYDGKISLREAIAYANADAAALAEGTITVSELADANGIYTISFADFGKDMYGAPYLRVYLNADNGALNINTNITIDGGTADRITTNSASLKPVAAALSESVARGIIISAADSTSAETRKDVEIKIADDATLTVKNYLTISHWHGMAEDKEVQTSDDIKSRVNLTGKGNVTISENAKLSVYDSFEIGTLVNNGSLFLYGENNAFSAADGGDFGNVTYVALHHSAKSVGGLVKVDIADPNIVAGTYETLSVYSADLIRYQGWSRVPWYYGSTVANSQDGGTLYSQALATLTANGNVTAENLILGDGVTLNIMENLDADVTTIGTNQSYTGISTPVRGALSVSGNFDGGTITNNGTLTLSGAENTGSGTLGNVTYNGTADQTIISGTYGDLIIATAGTATVADAVTATTTTVNSGATLDANGDLTAGTLTNSGTVKVAGAFSATAENLGNVTYDGTEQTILAGTYGNLTLENGTKTLSTATVNGTFTATSTTLQKAVDAGSNATLTLTDAGISTEPSGTVSNTTFNGISVTNTAGDGNLYVNAQAGNSVDDASTGIVLVGLSSISVGGYGTDGTLNATYGETLTLTETRKEITVNIDGEDVTLYLDVTWKLSDELSGDMSMSGFVNAGTYNGVLTVDTVKAYTKDGEVYTEVTNRYTWDKSVTSNLVIGKATITVSGITANGKTYDGNTSAAVDTTGAIFTGKVTGDVLTITATGAFADANAGANKAVTGTLELTGAAKDNYELTANTFTTTATITAKDVTLAWEKADSYTYTGKDQGDTVKAYYTDLNGEKQYVDVTFDNTFRNAGDYTASAEAPAGGNYNWSASSLGLTIAQAKITVTADAVSKTYGAADPTLTYKVTGLVNGETEANVLSGALSRDAGENVGTYAITKGTLAASDNYDLVFNTANLTINKATLTVTADAVSKTYGADDPTLTYKVSGLVNGDTAEDVLSGALTRAAGENVDTYAITQGTLTASNNYALSFTGANLTINKATLTVTADAVSKTYGEADPTLTYTVSGLVNGDVEADVVSGILSRTAGEDVGTYAITPGNITVSSNYTLAFAGATLTINKATITISNIAAADREYNGETGANVTFDKSGIVAGDEAKVALAVTGTFADKNAAADKTVNLVWSLTGDAAGNYELSGNLTETTADITAKKITVTAADVTATYGQDYTLTHNGALLGSDTFTGALEVKSAAYSTANKLTVGTYAIGQGTLSAGTNYEITFVDGTLNVNKADLTVSTVTAADRAYNGTTSAELTGATYTGLAEGDVITLTGNGTFDSKNAGTQNVTFSGLAISGADAANYNLITTEKTTTATISKAAISITANNASKVYNTADPALEYTVTAGELFADDSITLSRETGDDVGTYAINGYTITDGNNGGNYEVTFTEGIFTIANKAATITVGTTTLTYNGAAQAATEYTVEGLEDGHKVSAITLTGATDAGSYDATVESITITDAGGNDVTSQYGLTYVAGKLNINKATITISNIAAADREYNGGTGADVTFDKSGIVAVDDAKITLSVTGVFADKNVGTDKAVSLTWSLTGDAAGNYELSGNEATATATITAKEISISGITAADKTYDGNDTTTVDKSAASLTGNVAGDDLDFTVTGLFADKNAATDKTVNLTVTLTGADKDNYIFAAGTQKTATATINKAQITISGITAANKTYDGNTTATLDYSNAVFGGIVGSDKLTVTATGVFESASAGTGKNVAISNLTLGGESLANYELAATGNQTETTATINKAALTVMAKDAAITYGGDHSAILSSSYTVTGMVNGEAASVVTGAMGIENAANLSGAGKLKADATDLYKFTLGTLTAANYDITFVAQDGTDVKALTVNKLDLSATVDFAASKVYDGTTAVTVNSSFLNTVLANDTVTFNAELVYNDANVANANRIIRQTWEITGADAANYNLAAFTETAGTITAKSVELVWSSADTTYTYNGAVQSVTATYTDVTGATQNAVVSFGDGVTFKNAGDYTATAAAVANYSFTNATQNLTINKLALTVTGASDTVTYDGNVHTLNSVTPGDTIVQGHTVSTTATATGTAAGEYVLNIANAVIVKDAEGNDVTANYEIATTNGKLTINQKVLSVADIVANITAQTYDGDTTLDSATLTIDGVTISWTGAAFNSANVKEVATATFTGLTVDSNYALSADTVTVDATGKITAKEITVSGITASNKVYDGNTTATVNTTGATFTGMITGDNLTVSTTGSFADKNVGTGKTVTFGALTLGGTDAGNYILADASQKTTTADITAKEISLGGLTVADKVYDGTKVAEITGIGFADGAIISGDTVTVNTTGATANFESANAADSIKVTASGFALSGTDAGNYKLISDSIETTAGISKATISVNDIKAAITEQIYDGDTTVDAATLTVAGIGTDGTLTVNYTSGAFNSANVKDVATATFSGLSLTNGNYQLSADTVTVDATGKITAKDVTLAWEKADSYTYTGADQSGTVKAYYTDVTGAKQYVSVTFDNAFRNAGDYTASAEASAADCNYKYAASSLDLTIAKAKITVSGITATDREYNGGTGADVTFDKSGIVAADNAKVTLTVTGAFDNKNVGTDKAVSLTWSLTGEAAGNYELSGNAAATTADITAKEITVSGITASNKVYDGNTTATVNTTGATFTGMITGDNLTVSTSGTFGDKNVGTGKTVTFGALTLGGTDAANYILADASQKTATADITAKEISINGVTIADKIYDGNTTATITGTTVSGVIGSDVVSVDFSGANANFVNANVGTGIQVNADGLALAGADSANYKLTSNAFETTGNITKATVTVTADAQSKVYGEADPALSYQVTGLVGSDALTGELTRTEGENVGTYAITQGTLKASDNYDLVFNGADLTITKATVTVTADAQSKVYGEADPALTYNVTGLVGSDALTGELTRDAGENVGAYAITQGTLSAGENYNMTFTGAVFTILEKPILVDPSANAATDASSPDYSVYGKPQREARTAWLQDAMAPFTGGKFSVTSADEDGRRRGVELGFDATPISTSVQTHHEMYGIHDDEILDDHKVFDRYEHHVIEAQEPVSLDGDTEMDLSAAQDVMDVLDDLLLEIPAVELTARASQFHDDFDAALNDLLTI